MDTLSSVWLLARVMVRDASDLVPALLFRQMHFYHEREKWLLRIDAITPGDADVARRLFRRRLPGDFEGQAEMARSMYEAVYRERLFAD